MTLASGNNHLQGAATRQQIAEIGIRFLALFDEADGLRTRVAELEAENAKLRGALRWISEDAHLPDQPASDSSTEIEWALRWVAKLRRRAAEALKMEG